MFRLAARNLAARSLNVAARPAAVAPRLALAARSTFVPHASFSAAAGLSKEDITQRVMDVLSSYEKVKVDKLTPSASFAGDLGLDSLDAVEVVIAIEEEFAIEIPDNEADSIKTVQEAIDYIAKTPEGMQARNLFSFPSMLIGCCPSPLVRIVIACVPSLSFNRNPCCRPAPLLSCPQRASTVETRAPAQSS
ncbi:acyl carrier protein [Epithele typhae]|uniref:acyl carrier protein n=1 Tax=Epithele typhae TaxID=378194 RepID=UPI002007D97C|nr:acyl carrier protein [Epithele typhae]KAH9944054.1 acyl carrier protein [Epithele typhae]